MGSREYTAWKAFADLRPFGNEGADLRAGIIAAALAGGKPIDYMPIIRALQNIPKRRKAATAAMMQTAKAIAEALRNRRGR